MAESNFLGTGKDDAIQSFSKLDAELSQRIDNLRTKRELLLAQREGEMVTVWMMDSWSAADSLCKQEENVLKNKKEMNELNISIVDDYTNLTEIQSRKASLILKKLKAIKCKSEYQPCPSECTMQSFNEWSKTDARINELQSKILTSLSKKVRLTQETAKNDDNETADGVSSELQRFELKRKFQQLRQKGYTIIDEQALIDQRFVDFVQELLNVNGTNFESLKLREHIDQCAAETKGTFMIGERESPVDSAASPNSYQSFVCAMSQYLLNKYGKSNYSVDPDSAANLDQAYSIVEEILFPHVEHFIEPLLEIQTEKDSLLCEKYQTLASLDQRMIGVSEKFIDTSIYPHCKAISLIMQVNMATTPSQKLKLIVQAAHEVIDFMSTICGKDDVPGADEFMDIWVYVLLKARLPNLFKTVALLRGYSNPRIGLSESGYYLASFELAGEYIRTLTEGSCTRNPEASQIFSETFFVPEMSRWRQMSKCVGTIFEVVEEDFSLDGFRLIADLDLQLEKGRLFTTFLERDLRCTINGALVQVKSMPNSKSTESWVKSQMTKKFKNVETNVINGATIPVRVSCSYQQNTNEKNGGFIRKGRYIELSSGRYGDYQILLQRYLGLERLGYGKQGLINQEHNGTVTDLVGNELSIEDMAKIVSRQGELFLADYCSDESGDIGDKINQRVQEIQAKLQHFGAYSKVLPVDGVFSLGTLHGVRHFQIMFNERKYGNNDTFLQADGICDLKTYQCLFDSEIS